MSWQVHQLSRSLGAHASDWDAAVTGLTGSHPMLSSAFIEGLLQRFGDGSEYLCTLRDHAQLIAMCIVKRRGNGFWTTFLPSQAQVGPLVVENLDDLQSLVRALPGHALAIDLLCVDPTVVSPLNDATSTAVKTLHATTMNIHLLGTFNEYWTSRPSGLRQNLRRYERRAASDGLSPRLSTLTKSEEMRDAVWRYAELESRGWKGATGTALSPCNEQGRFYADVLTKLASIGQAEVHELWMGGNLAASRLVTRSSDGGMLIMLKTTYDEALDTYAPGRLLLRMVLERMFLNYPGGVVEFYTDATQDQLAWATACRPIKHWTIFRNTATLRAVRMANRLRNVVAPINGDLLEICRDSAVSVFDDIAKLPPDALRLLDTAAKDEFRLGTTWHRLAKISGGSVSARYFVLHNRNSCGAVLTVATDAVGKPVLGKGKSASVTAVTRLGMKTGELTPLAIAIRDNLSAANRIVVELQGLDSDTSESLAMALELSGLPVIQLPCASGEPLGIIDSDRKSTRANHKRHSREVVQMWLQRFESRGGRLQTAADRGGIEKLLNAVIHSGQPDDVADLSRVAVELLPLADRGWVRFGAAWVGEKLHACQWWVAINGKAWRVQSSESSIWHQSPATPLLSAVLRQQVVDHNGVIVCFDLTTSRLQMQIHQIDLSRSLVAYQPRRLGGAVGLLCALIHPLAARPIRDAG